MKKIVKILCIAVVLALAVIPLGMSFAESVKNKKSIEDKSAESNSTEDKSSIDDRLKNAIALYIGSSQALVNNVETQVDSTNANVKPYIKDGRTLVPVRFVSESIGAQVDWDRKNSRVTIKLNNKVVELVIGNKIMKVGDKEEVLDVAPEISEGRTYLPLRSLVEALGKKVFYDRGLIVISDREDVFDVSKDKGLIDEVISRVNNLPRVGSVEELKKMLENSGWAYGRSRGIYLADELAVEADLAVNSAPVAEKAKMSEAEGSIDYSTTNVQVEGVDEADVVKTDGKYIYQINNNRVVVIKAYDTVAGNAYSASGMKIESMLNFDDDSFYPQELYVDGDYLVAIGNHYENVQADISVKKRVSYDIHPFYLQRTTVKAIVFDISDRANIEKLREVEVEGNYVSSRKIDSVLYLVANMYPNIYYLETEPDKIVPSYRDTAVSDKYIDLKCTDIRYFPNSKESNFMNIAAFDITSNEEVNIQTYLGAGENIYASSENLYVSVTNYNYGLIRPLPADVLTVEPDAPVSNKIAAEPIASDLPSNRETTTVYKFSLNGTKVTYLNKGDVPGRILNQFSMDEYNGFFRIATTVGDAWGTGDNVSKNNVYILDDTMNITGKIEDIAPGEMIYSVRFMGKRAYVVTFKTVDPLFVIDLEEPSKPKILGALKIPGYSDYLHPYDENHIIGFGKDTVEIKGNAYYKGMKIALFDVSDVTNPIQKFSEIIGDRGTESDVLNNHKALLFSKNKNLLAFPVTVMEVDDAQKDESLAYGRFTFQGAYVYSIDAENGFKLRGKITHLSDEDYKKSGYYYNPEKHVERILYIGDTLYTLSKGMVKAHELWSMEESGSIMIPKN